MKIPKEIFGDNKIRDAMIIKLFSEGYSCPEIKELRNLSITIRRIEQIVYKNKAFVKIDRDFEEAKQINRIKGHIKRAIESKKDVYDWETLLDSKITPKKVEHIGSGETRIILIRDNADNRTSTQTISRQVSF